jgi:hypothetical protein
MDSQSVTAQQQAPQADVGILLIGVKLLDGDLDPADIATTAYRVIPVPRAGIASEASLPESDRDMLPSYR